jgi:hypothetical protein
MFKSRYNIVNNYTVLHFDEWDILFAGKNAYDEWIVGSLAYDDEENNVLHHYYLVVSEKSLTRFLKREINYRTLFQEAITIFKTLRDINENLKEKPLELDFEEINKKSLPSEKGFCPSSDESDELLHVISRHKIIFSGNWQIFSQSDIIKIGIAKKKDLPSQQFKSIRKIIDSRNIKKYV